MKFLILIIIGVVAALESSPSAEYEIVNLKVPTGEEAQLIQGNSSYLSRGGRMVNSYEGDGKQFPWIVSVDTIHSTYINNHHTGSLITYKWILGSKRNIDYEVIEYIVVYMGFYAPGHASVSRYCDKYAWIKSTTEQNNPGIALFSLSEIAPFSDTISPIRLPTVSSLTYEDQHVIAIGIYLHRHKWSPFKVLPESECGSLKIFLCMVSSTGDAAFDLRDLGGSTVVYNNSIPTIIGVNTFVTDQYQGATRVNIFLNYISAITGIALVQ